MARKFLQVEKRRAVVLGGGVTGLTVAHELAERGFRVTVVEANGDPRYAHQPQVGGMARTQWVRAPWLKALGDEEQTVQKTMQQAFAPLDFHDPDCGDSTLHRSLASPWPEMYFAKGSKDVTKSAKAGIETAAHRLDRIADRLVEHFEEIRGRMTSPDMLKLLKEIGADVFNVDGFRSSEEAGALAGDRAMAASTRLRDGLVAKLPAAHYVVVNEGTRFNGEFLVKLKASSAQYELALIQIHNLGDAVSVESDRDPWQRRLVRVSASPKWLPGEHGYRFFPRFYRHLLDTMKRTPILRSRPMTPTELAERKRDGTNLDLGPAILETTGKSAYDQLIPVLEHDFAPADASQPRRLKRFQAPSFVELRRNLEVLQGDLGWTNRDLMLSQLKLLQFATSCDERRTTYEEKSWFDYVGGDTPGWYSDAFRESLGRWPAALIGLRADDVDARTVGATALQQFLDLLNPIGYRDGTLCGPTSASWLDHWQRYLGTLNVRFRKARVTRLKLERPPGKLPWIKPILDPPLSSENVDERYVVVALPVEEVRRLAMDLESQLTAAEKDYFETTAIAKVVPILNSDRTFRDSWLKRRAIPGPLQHFAGIQYFLAEDYRYEAGHIFFPDAPWGLTAISQNQFRQDSAANKFTYQGVISVIIGAWDVKGSNGKVAWRCTDQELAEECWKQVVDGFGDTPPPTPKWFHIDQAITFDGARRRNRTPYLTNPPGAFADWPGKPREYTVEFGNLALAGTFMQTFTRLNTMEAANESGRHATAAILKDWRSPGNAFFAGNPPETWSYEEREPDDLEFLKRIDKRLFEEGLPHALEIAVIPYVADATCDDESAYPSSLPDALVRLSKSQNRTIRSMYDSFLSLTSRFGGIFWP